MQTLYGACNAIVVFGMLQYSGPGESPGFFYENGIILI